MGKFGGLVSALVPVELQFLVSTCMICVLCFSCNVGGFSLVLEADKAGEGIAKNYNLASLYVCCKLNYFEDSQGFCGIDGTLACEFK